MEISVIAQNKLFLIIGIYTYYLVYGIFFFSFPVKIKRFIIIHSIYPSLPNYYVYGLKFSKIFQSMCALLY